VHFAEIFYKNVVVTSELNFFKCLAFFSTCFGCFLPENTTNKNRSIIEILINHFMQYSKSPDMKASRPRLAKMGHETSLETETKSLDASTAKCVSKNGNFEKLCEY